MLQTNLDTGLSSGVVSAIREISGPNEFTVESQEKALSKFLKQFYESPLILLLLGSAGVSAAVGNYDDSVSITLAIVIVVTGAYATPKNALHRSPLIHKRSVRVPVPVPVPTRTQSVSCKSSGQRRASKRSTSSSRTIAMSSGTGHGRAA
jgi:magnesium-transporting ATPase (P-type)